MHTNLSNWRPDQRGFLKTCPVCADDFIGRKNKRYCTTACKNRYHNDRNAETREQERAISYTLLSNDRILKRLFTDVPEGKTLRVSLKRMKSLGFDVDGPVTEIEGNDKLWYKVGNEHAYRVDHEHQQVIISKLN